METITLLEYEEKKEEFLQFGERIIKEGLEPYCQEIKGEWKSSILRKNFEAALQRGLDIKGFFNPLIPLVLIWDYQRDKTIQEISRRLAAELSNQIYLHYQQQGKGLIYVLDFRCYRNTIFDKLENILNFKNNKSEEKSQIIETKFDFKKELAQNY